MLVTNRSSRSHSQPPVLGLKDTGASLEPCGAISILQISVPPHTEGPVIGDRKLTLFSSMSRVWYISSSLLGVGFPP